MMTTETLERFLTEGWNRHDADRPMTFMADGRRHGRGGEWLRRVHVRADKIAVKGALFKHRRA